MTRGRNVPLWTAIVASLIALGLVGLHTYVKPLPGIETAEGLSIDGRFRLRGSRARHPEVLQTRRGYADLIRAFTKYNVKVIALDLFFSSPEVILPDELERDVRTQLVSRS